MIVGMKDFFSMVDFGLEIIKSKLTFFFFFWITSQFIKLRTTKGTPILPTSYPNLANKLSGYGEANHVYYTRSLP